jgi:squalene-associated FAD-dependent desaturase
MIVHVVGAGVAGLSAALALHRAKAGIRVILHEAAPHAGGRCRSWIDRRLGTEIDNGTHAVLGANTAVLRHVAQLGTDDEIHWLPDGPRMVWPARGATWTLGGPGDLVRVWRQLDGRAAREVATALRLLLPVGPSTVGARLARGGALADAVWDPLTRAVMNTPASRADAGAFARVLRMTLLRGAAAMRMGVARTSLGRCFVDPALDLLRAQGAEVRFGARLRAISGAETGKTGLAFSSGSVELRPEDRVILALPPWELDSLIPGLAPPWTESPIVNLHVRLDGSRASGTREPRMTGLVGTAAEWVLDRGDVASVTASAAMDLAAMDAPDLAALLWRDVAPVLGCPGMALPGTWRIVKERRATPLQTPEFATARRALLGRGGHRLPASPILAGDWTLPDLPCTIETALRSGTAAARRIMTEAARAL